MQGCQKKAYESQSYETTIKQPLNLVDATQVFEEFQFLPEVNKSFVRRFCLFVIAERRN